MRITTLASVVIPCLGFSASSIAAAEDVMIVSASGYEKKLTNAAASVSVISQEELQSSQYHDLAEALRSVEVWMLKVVRVKPVGWKSASEECQPVTR